MRRQLKDLDNKNKELDRIIQNMQSIQELFMRNKISFYKDWLKGTSLTNGSSETLDFSEDHLQLYLKLNSAVFYVEGRMNFDRLKDYADKLQELAEKQHVFRLVAQIENDFKVMTDKRQIEESKRNSVKTEIQRQKKERLTNKLFRKFVPGETVIYTKGDSIFYFFITDRVEVKEKNRITVKTNTYRYEKKAFKGMSTEANTLQGYIDLFMNEEKRNVMFMSDYQ